MSYVDIETYKCPKCGDGMTYELEEFYGDDGDTRNIECSECHFKSVVTIRVSIEYDVECTEHSWKPRPSEKYEDCYECEYCDDIKFLRYNPDLLAKK